MTLAQEIVPIDSLIEAGIVTILGIVILVGVISFFYMIRLYRTITENTTKQDANQDEVTAKLVTLTSNAISNTEKLHDVLESNTQALIRNTDGYQNLAAALLEFKSGIEAKLNENTKALQDLAAELKADGKLSISSFIGITFPIELPDGIMYVVEVLAEEDGLKVKLTKQELENGNRDSTAPQ